MVVPGESYCVPMMERQEKKGELVVRTVLAKRGEGQFHAAGPSGRTHCWVSTVRQDGQDRESGWIDHKLRGGDSIQGRKAEACDRAGEAGIGGKRSRNCGMLAASSELPQKQQSREEGRDLAIVSTPLEARH